MSGTPSQHPDRTAVAVCAPSSLPFHCKLLRLFEPGAARPPAASLALAPTAALLAVLIPVAACGGSAESGAEATGPDAVYEVRGEIARLPDPSSPEIWIRHESIPEFRNASGDIVGMDSMTMPFGLADETPVEELAVGDRIAFRLEIDWDAAGSPSRVVDVRALEPGTRLDFDPLLEAEPDVGAAPALQPAAAAGGGTSPR